MRRILLAATAPLALSLAGCATSSSGVGAAYISPIAYDAYNCQQLGAELQRISARVQQVSGTVDQRASNDSVAMGVGIVLFWPALFFLKGDGPETQELARLKGEYDAVNQAAIRKSCGYGMQPAPAAEMAPAPTQVSAPAPHRKKSHSQATNAQPTVVPANSAPNQPMQPVPN